MFIIYISVQENLPKAVSVPENLPKAVSVPENLPKAVMCAHIVTNDIYQQTKFSYLVVGSSSKLMVIMISQHVNNVSRKHAVRETAAYLANFTNVSAGHAFLSASTPLTVSSLQ